MALFPVVNYRIVCLTPEQLKPLWAPRELRLPSAPTLRGLSCPPAALGSGGCLCSASCLPFSFFFPLLSATQHPLSPHMGLPADGEAGRGSATPGHAEVLRGFTGHFVEAAARPEIRSTPERVSPSPSFSFSLAVICVFHPCALCKSQLHCYKKIYFGTLSEKPRSAGRAVPPEPCTPAARGGARRAGEEMKVAGARGTAGTRRGQGWAWGGLALRRDQPERRRHPSQAACLL